MDALGSEVDLPLLGVFVDVLPFGSQVQAGSSDLRLVSAAATVALKSKAQGNVLAGQDFL